MVWIKLAICILVIFFSGQKVAKYGDIIAERKGLSHAWVGLIVVALVTSLPELFTGISAVTLIDVPDLTVGDIIGANSFNLLNLAILDILHRNGSIFSMASPIHRLTGWLSLLLLAVAAISILISTRFYPMPLGWIGWYTPIIIVLYIFSVRHIFRAERDQSFTPEKTPYSEQSSSRKVYLYFGISALFIIGAGSWLATIGDEIAMATGWGHSFVGSLLLAFSTTLPEVTVSVAALRIGAVDMAIGNMIGSNLFNLTIIPIADLVYVKGPILSSIAQGQMVTAVTVIAMTLLLIAGLRFKPDRFLRLSWWSCATVIIFLAGAYCSFNIS